MSATVRPGELHPGHRARVAEILRATGVFRDEEIAVALELFDDAMTAAPEASVSPSHQPARQDAPHASPGTTAAAPSSSDYLFLGAFTPEDELAGYACYGPSPGTDRTWDLYWIAVHPDAQGAGGGTCLLGEVERRLEALNARMLVVETSSRSAYIATRAFYARNGYVEAARMRDFYAPADDRIIITKRFQAPPRGAEMQS